MVSIGFVLSDEQFIAPELVEYGAAAEEAGFDMIWISDHFHPWQDNQEHSGLAWITLGALGQRLKRVPMGTGVTCPTFRYNPAIVAQGFATLGVLYLGRIWLGVGSGEAVNELPVTGLWPGYEERSQRMAEAITIIRQLWRGDWVDYAGEYYQISGAKLYDVPEQMIPIYVAASGKKSMHLAGLYGDGVISDAKSLAKPEGKAALREGAEAGGKNPDQLSLSVESFVFVGRKDDARKPAEKWRFSPKSFTEYLDNPDPRDIQRRAEQDIPLDKVLEEWVIGEDPQVHIDAIQKLADAGISNIFIHSAQEDQHMMIDFYGKQVLPNVKHEAMNLHSLEAETVG